MNHHETQRTASDSYDVLIVGAGPTGALVAERRRPRASRFLFWKPVKDSAFPIPSPIRRRMPQRSCGPSRASHVGADFVVPKTGMGVGGGTLPWLGVMPRFHRDDFRTHSTEGVGADWPIGYDDLRPHYETVKREFGVAGECGPFAPEVYTLPMPPHRMNWHARCSHAAHASSEHIRLPPDRDQLQDRDGRPACIYCGWCGSGCPTEAKATRREYLPRAGRAARGSSRQWCVRASGQLRSVTGRAAGVEYLDSHRRGRIA